ncbi:MAG: hypothetical protein KU28_01695 [Sulfurovum sp. PC08-66]|nr:MAG: hypothetical protein KU28_01695 [Sulfurovum sp. PC08-66]KIM12650.1 MAG: hypothetical protein KU37_01800 [Sulfuricurvum sp. PC08-66]
MAFTVTNQPNGVKAILGGLSASTIAPKIEACQSGECSCDCDPAIMAKISAIEVVDSQEGAVMTITGSVDAQTLAPMMQACLIDKA